MKSERISDQVKTTAAIIGFIVAGLLFWKLVSAFMWACHYAGIPM